jgi:hypothetical protein
MVSQMDLLAAARELAGAATGPSPSQANLRRAVSTTYFALFHCMAGNCADMLVGEPGSGHSEPAWNQAYRALQHHIARDRCRKQEKIRRFPSQIQRFADQFATMQEKRERADYDPAGTFEQPAVIEDINLSEYAIAQFSQAPERDRRAFAVYVLLTLRND